MARDETHNPTDLNPKHRLSEVVRRARKQGLLKIKAGGEKAVVALSADYEAITAPDEPKTLKDLILSMNLDGVDLTRDQQPARDIDL